MPTKNKRMQRGSKHKRSKHKRTKKRMQRRSYKKMKGGMQRGGSFFSFFNSNIKPKNLVDKKTPADIFRMKQPITIEDDFFEKYKDELDALAIPTNIREALQMMMDMRNKETVFNKCYKDKGTGSKVHSNPAIQAAAVQQAQAPAAAPSAAQPAAPATQSEEDEEEDDEEEEDEDEEEEQAPAAPAQAPAPAPAAPVQKGGAKRTRRSRGTKKARKARKSRRTRRS